MVFAYKGITREGKKVSDRIEAPSLEDAKRRLQSRGIYYEKVYASSESILARIERLRTPQLPTKILSNFSRNLSIYLKAGIPIIQAVRLLKNDTDHARLRDFLIAVETMIAEGQSFYTSLESQKVIVLPSFFKQSVKVAEENGLLELVLLELADFLKQQERIAKQISKAMTYPLFIIILASLMVGVMLTVIVPKITEIFTQMDKALPPLTQFVIDAGDFLGGNWLWVLILLIIAISSFSYAKRTFAPFGYRVDAFMLRMPLIGRLIKTSELARFSFISSMLLRSGVPFVHTAKLSANIIDSAPIKAKISQAAIYVVEGKKFSQSLHKAGFDFDRSFVQAIALGEETSQLPQMLENLAQLYNEENKDKTDTFLGLLEPMLIVVVGIIMGVIVAAMLLPIFSLNVGAS
ncbi:MAG: hypothetical protein KU37_04020 [Sulfuricurvum sp. PC08-66]|nr:MAG: hypothetical protein KU37_04020 [Sulfuricurvum sp. PC08-66]